MLGDKNLIKFNKVGANANTYEVISLVTVGKLNNFKKVWNKFFVFLCSFLVKEYATHQGGINFKPELRVRNQDYGGMKVDHFVVEKR